MGNGTSKTAVLRRAKRQADLSISSIHAIGAPLATVVGDLSFGSLGLSNPNDFFIALGSPVGKEAFPPDFWVYSSK